MNWNTEFKGRWRLQTWLVDVQIILLNFHRVLMIDGLKFSIYHVAQEFHVTKSFQCSESASDPPGIVRVHWVWFPWFFLSCHIFFLCSSSVSVNDAGPQLVIFWGPLSPKGPGQKRRKWNLVTGTCRQIRETLVLRGSNCLVLLAKIHLDLPTGSIVARLIPKPWVLSTSTFLEWLSSNSPFSKNLMCKLDENICVNHTRLMYLSAMSFQSSVSHLAGWGAQAPRVWSPCPSKSSSCLLLVRASSSPPARDKKNVREVIMQTLNRLRGDFSVPIS